MVVGAYADQISPHSCYCATGWWFWPGIPLILASDRGCITSTPKSAEKVKKRRFWPKYERDSCIPRPKNGERPYLAVPETTFWGSILGLFWAIF